MKMLQLQCFNQEPHGRHEWTFFYDSPAGKHICPGVEKDD